MSKQKKEPEYFPGSEYKGYIAHSCVPSVWIDRYDSGRSIDCYRLTLQTPYSPGIADEELDRCLKADLTDIFPDIGLIGHNETNRRAFDDDYYKPFGCRKQVMWSRGTCTVILLLLDEFEGFPAESEPPHDMDSMLEMYMGMV